MQCQDCGTPNPAGARFCGQCGHALALVCPSCGARIEGDQRYCRECGALLEGAPGAGDDSGAVVHEPSTERRVVSVMFADLVGSTPMAEGRDAEEVRDLLSQYFDMCRRVVDRYGGTIEKFIGDAVMAVWGAPTAHQDDPERAVRAALDIVAEVAALGEESGVGALAARAGVGTGEVAVTVGAVGQGIVTGDTVNTAARIQTAARPGGVRVDARTRSASVAAISYEDAGAHELKGKAGAHQLYDAVRVVATVGGVQRVDGLEAPFVGRARELRLVKELYHATEESGHARLLSVTGPAGVGKSRLGWELFKYLDGLAGDVLWHSGRCPPYGEGVALWPLTEMVRMRFGMQETDSRADVAEKLRSGLEEYIGSVEDRDWLTPRLGALLGLDGDEVVPHPREELFGAWRLLFETLARRAPVVMLVEELQWADSGLVGFVDDLLDLSRDFPIFVLTLARPELEERRPGWGSGRRNATSLSLEPLSDDAARELVDGLVAGLPTAAREAIVRQANGIPLYAVETVRMLVDKGLVLAGDDRYEVSPGAESRLSSRDVADLGLPPSLAALIRARLDDLPATERALVADAAVLGTSFRRDSLGRLVDLPSAELDRALRSLLRKELFTVTVDPRSPERGQYRFMQPLVRTIAYETISRHDRKLKHLAVAERLEADAADPTEIADVLADHYHAAFQAAGSDPDAGDIRARARRSYRTAADRALGLAAPENALAAYRRVTDLAVDEAEEAEGLSLAGRAAVYAGLPVAVELLERAIELHETAGRVDAAVQATLDLARAHSTNNRASQAADILRRSLAAHDRGVPDENAARVAALLAITCRFAGRMDEVAPAAEVALTYAQALELPDVMATALMGRANLMMDTGRWIEAEIGYHAIVQLAERHDLTLSLAGGTAGLANLRLMTDLPEAREPAERAAALWRRVGVRQMQMTAVGNLALLELMTGRWDRAELLAREALELENAPVDDLMHERLVVIHALRGELEQATSHAEACVPYFESDDPETRAMAKAAGATVALAKGDLSRAYALAMEALEDSRSLSLASEGPRQAWPDALEAAVALGDLSAADELLAVIAVEPPGRVPAYLKAQHLRCRALVAHACGESQTAEPDLRAALEAFRSLEFPFWVARTLLDLARVLIDVGGPEQASGLLEEAEATFASLGARPWVEQVRFLTG